MVGETNSPDFPQMIYMIQMAMLFAGVATLIQTIGFGPVGARLPVVQGTSFAFIPIMIPLVAGKGVDAMAAVIADPGSDGVLVMNCPAAIGSGSEAAQAVQAGATSDLAVLEPGHRSAASGSTSDGAHELTSAARYQRVRDALLQALLPHFDYPPLARRRGWQGRVRIGLLVKADGDLSGVHLIESSGYALLDKAAIKNVSQLRNVPAAGRWLNGRNLDVILPVTYRLE